MSVSRRASFAAGIAAVRRQKKAKMSANRENMDDVVEGMKNSLDKLFHSTLLLMPVDKGGLEVQAYLWALGSIK